VNPFRAKRGFDFSAEPSSLVSADLGYKKYSEKISVWKFEETITRYGRGKEDDDYDKG
jgi:hypothetical protein